MPQRKYTKEQLEEKQLTKWIVSILRLSNKDELKTREIYEDIQVRYKYKEKYPDRKKQDGSIKTVGFNYRTLLDNLNAMTDFKLTNKRIDKNNVAFWCLSEHVSLLTHLAEEDKFIIDSMSSEMLMRNNPEYGINLYGFPTDKSSIGVVHKDYKNDLQESKSHFQKGLEKIKQGMNEIQYARDTLFEIHKQTICDFIIKTSKISLLNKRIFSILMFYNYRLSNEKQEEIVEKYLTNQPLIVQLPFHLGIIETSIDAYPDFKQRAPSLVISDPHPHLIKILKDNFKDYSTKSDNQMKKMLEGYEFPHLNDFLYISVKIPLSKLLMPLAIVAHSANLFRFISGIYRIRDIKREGNVLKIKPSEIDKQIIQRDKKVKQKYSYSDFVDKTNKKTLPKCPQCGKKMGTRRVTIDMHLKKYMKWLT